MFKNVLKREVISPFRFERVHKLQRINKSSTDIPRYVIARFHPYGVKEQVSHGMKNAASIDFNGTKLLIFTDIAPKTLAHRRALKPFNKSATS